MSNVVVLGTSDSIVAKLAGAITTLNPTFNSSWVDVVTNSTSSNKGSTNGTTEVTLVSSPSSGQRQVDTIRIYNEDSVSVVVTVQVANGASRYTLGKWTLTSGSFVDVLASAATASSSSSGGDLLSTLLQAEISVTAGSTATLGAMHVCSGTTADYTVTLPAASGNAGKMVGLRMDPALTKLVTIDGNASETIDGATTRVMWAGETAILHCNGTSWTKIAGKSIPMICKLAPTGTQSSTANTEVKISLSSAVFDNASMGNTSTYRITCRRTGTYNLHAAIMYVASGGANSVQIRVYKNGGTLYFQPHARTESSINFMAEASKKAFAVTAADYFELYSYLSAATGTTDVSLGLTSMTLEEIITW